MRLFISRLLASSSILVLGLGCQNTPDDPTPEERGDAPLGARCASSSDCQSALCLTEEAPLFENGGPAGGICSASCEDDTPCPGGSTCVETKAGLRCLPSCSFGDDSSKCQGRNELACEPLLVTTDRGCDADDECNADELCFETDAIEGATGRCERVLGVCSPRCGSDRDCNGRSCDLGSGECVNEAPTGLPAGASCDIANDECAGNCVAIDDEHAECEERCRIGAASGCGESDLDESQLVCGFFAYDLSGLDVKQGAGDTGVCANFCNCNDECPGDQRCLNSATENFAGLCAGGIDLEKSLPCSPDDGDGGGGAGGGGS